jgi:CelD/BcsL family acetyltransferase involved in cellulose biosynthesis
VACADDTMVGVEYAFCFRQRYYFYLNGFDPAFARYSLGSLLMLDAIRQAIGEGCLEVDFLRGDEPYKAQLGALSERVNYRLRLWRSHSLRSQALLCLERLPGRMAPLVKLKRQLAEIIHRTGVRDPSVGVKEGEG